MRKLILLSVLAIVAGAALWQVLQHDPGYVLVVVAGKTIEMRFAFALLLLMILVLLLMGLWRLLRGGIRVLRFSRRRGALKTELRTQRGLLSFIAGNWSHARRHLLKAARRHPKPLLHYLAAARSAHELGDVAQAHELLNKAEPLAPHNELAVLVTRARLQLADKEYQACLATLLRAKTVVADHPVVLDLLQRVYIALGDWAACELLLGELERHRLMSANELEKLGVQTYIHLLNEAGKNVRGQGQDEAAVLALGDIWRRPPKNLKRQPSLLAVYCRWLILAQQHESAETLLRQGLQEQWTEALVELYGLAAPANRQAQLNVAQRWLTEHAEDAELHLALGRLSLRNELWGQAREHFQKSLELRPTPATYAELARLLAALGERQLSAEYYQRGLLLTTHGLPTLPLPSGKTTSSSLTSVK